MQKRNGIFHLIYEHPKTGKRTSVSTRQSTKKEALLFLQSFKPDKNLEEKKTITLKQFKKEFLIYSELNHKESTHEGYKTTFKYFYEFAKDIKLSEITTQMLNSYFIMRRLKGGLLKSKKGNLYQTRKDRLQLHKAFNWAIKLGYLEKNPCTGTDRVRLPQKLPLFYTRDEFNTFTSNLPDQDLKDLCIFTVNTGLREQEVLNLKWEQINWKNKVVILDNQNHITKSSRVRSVPMNSTAFQIIERRKANNNADLIFTRDGKLITPDFISKLCRRALKKSNINKKLNFHSLRHTFASWLVQKGVSIYTVKELLGHSDVRTTQIYSHLKPENLSSSTDLLDS